MSWKNKLHDIVFQTDSPQGKLFDLVLLVSIILSVIIVFLDSVAGIHDQYGDLLLYSEWFFTILFTIEYIIRIYISQKKMKYIFSFYGIIDFLAVLPSYISIFLTGTQYLIVIRVIRLLRIFRILKLDRYIGASSVLLESIRSSRHKITVFLAAVLTIVVTMGALMYLIEGPEHGFTNIPEGIYWAIVTLTTVGYGDISPHTFMGKVVASVIMILGYSIIAVPTGIITAELTRKKEPGETLKKCPECNHSEHDKNAVYCKLCGCRLDSSQ